MRPTKNLKWAQSVGRYVVPHLPLKDILRQEAIHELIRVEEVNFHSLEVLEQKFLRKMLDEHLISSEEAQLMFPGLPQLIGFHGSLIRSMWKLQEKGAVVKGFGDLLLPFFDAEEGAKFLQTAATFCSNHQNTVELIEGKMKADKKFKHFLKEAERLPPRGKISLCNLYTSEEQLVSAYPRLLQDILLWTEDDSKEAQVLQLCLERCQRFHAHITIMLEKMEEDKFLATVQKNLDTSALKSSKHLAARDFTDVDLTKRCLRYDGPLKWKINNSREVDVHALLYDNVLILLHKKGKRYVLKCRETADHLGKTIYSPIIQAKNIIARPVATDQTSFFIIDTSDSPRLYQFSASSEHLRNNWINALDEAAEKFLTGHSSPPSFTTIKIKDETESGSSQRGWRTMRETSV